MKQLLKRILNEKFGWEFRRVKGDREKYRKIYEKCKTHTMVGGNSYRENLELVDSVRHVQGDVVECGVWKGGMSAGIAYLLGPGRQHYLFDSFEGLPDATELDGADAKKYQENTDAYNYHDNCTADIKDAEEIMKRTGVSFHLVKGWFENTVPTFDKTDKIAVLRLDGDWYESTLICLRHFFPKVAPGGIVLIDDYYWWEGCSKAVHDYLSEIKSDARIYTGDNFAYILKK